MYKFDEQALRRGINMGLGSQGIWTPELENVMFDEITNEALRIHDVVGRSEQYFCCKDQINQRCSEQCFGCFQFENKD
jgi:hypothetical protein